MRFDLTDIRRIYAAISRRITEEHAHRDRDVAQVYPIIYILERDRDRLCVGNIGNINRRDAAANILCGSREAIDAVYRYSCIGNCVGEGDDYLMVIRIRA